MTNVKELYRLPWTANNNPNAWIEPTTYCQLKCPGCYRGLALENPKRKHESLEDLQSQIDTFISQRNVQTISIAGGEPLMYPQIIELIAYISQKGLKSKIYTNGILLSEHRLRALKDAGLTEAIIHIDRFQRKDATEKSVEEMREKHCEVFRRVDGVNLGFIQPISKQNISDLPVLAAFFQKNADIINVVVFTVYKEMLENAKLDDNLSISMDEVSTHVQDSFGLTYCAYLGKKQSSAISWLFSLSAYAKVDSSTTKLLGSFDAKFYRMLQERYFGKKKKYFITARRKVSSLTSLLLHLINKSVQKIVSRALSERVVKFHTQVVLIIDPPSKNSKSNNDSHKEWDLCDGCPDAMLYNGVLVPSCLLERIKSNDKIFVS